MAFIIYKHANYFTADTACCVLLTVCQISVYKMLKLRDLKSALQFS